MCFLKNDGRFLKETISLLKHLTANIVLCFDFTIL